MVLPLERTMLTLFDYLPSQNAWKVRLLLNHLQLPYRSEYISIFEGEGQRPEFLAVNPTGTVPALRLEDGRVLAESNAILAWLAHGTRYLPQDTFGQAKVMQWMSFEQDYVGNIATLRHWTMTGKLERRPAGLVAMRRAGSLNALRMLNQELATRPFIAGDAYTIADMSLYAYTHRAEEANLPLSEFTHVSAWVERVAAQEGFLHECHPYAIDPHSGGELP
jgi:glutathione S-transferase